MSIKGSLQSTSKYSSLNIREEVCALEFVCTKNQEREIESEQRIPQTCSICWKQSIGEVELERDTLHSE